MTNYACLGLQPGSNVFREHSDYLSGCQSFRLVFSGNNATFAITMAAVRAAFVTTVDSDISWLGDSSRHQNLAADIRLPGNLTYYGKYFPGAVSSRTESAVSLEPFECAHCAYLAAREIVAACSIPGLSPSVLWVDLREPVAPSSHNSTMMSESGELMLSDKTQKTEFVGSGCGNCGFPGHTRTTCDRPARHYFKVGVEIEGRFNNCYAVQEDVSDSGLTHCGDGSIHGSPFDGDCEPLEIQTKPGSVTEQLRWLSKFYPDEVDSSCGMHVHVSFEDSCCISQLATTEFNEYFLGRWRAWGASNNLSPNGQFFSRLNGHNEYCGPNEAYDLDNPFQADRYRQLNFTSWSEHKTLECRLLPMFNEARLAYSALVELVSIYEDWLGREAPPILPVQQVTASDVSAELGDLQPIGVKSELDIEQYSEFAVVEVATMDIIDLPPVPTGMVRVCTVPRDRINLDDVMMWRAAS